METESEEWALGDGKGVGAQSRHGAVPSGSLGESDLPGGRKRQHYSQTKQMTLVLLGRILRADFGVGVTNE